MRREGHANGENKELMYLRINYSGLDKNCTSVIILTLTFHALVRSGSDAVCFLYRFAVYSACDRKWFA